MEAPAYLFNQMIYNGNKKKNNGSNCLHPSYHVMKEKMNFKPGYIPEISLQALRN